MQTSRFRPVGITVLVILEVISSLLVLIAGVALAAFSGFIERYIPPQPVPGLFVSGLLVFIGIVLLIFSLVGFLVSWGLWTGQRWAWTLALILAVLGAIGGLLSLPSGIVSIIINGLIAWYLWQPNVKAFYSMQAPMPTAPPPPPQPSAPPGNVIYCSKCGTANSVDNKFCRNCGSELKSS